jgi:hypothetical protein
MKLQPNVVQPDFSSEYLKQENYTPKTYDISFRTMNNINPRRDIPKKRKPPLSPRDLARAKEDN